MKRELPQPYQDFVRDYPAVSDAYEALASTAHEVGPLDERARRLVKLAISVGGRLEGAVRSHARRAIETGITLDELDHVVVLALTTIGLPSTVAARTWIRDELGEPAKRRTKPAGGPNARRPRGRTAAPTSSRSRAARRRQGGVAAALR